jgi:hypothetical protein
MSTFSDLQAESKTGRANLPSTLVADSGTLVAKSGTLVAKSGTLVAASEHVTQMG